MSVTKDKWRISKLIFKLVLTIFALYWVLINVDALLLWRTIIASNPWMLAASFIAFFFSQLFASSRVRTFFTCIDLKLSKWYNYKLYLLGMFYNMFLPGGVGGDGYKVFFLHKKFGIGIQKLAGAVFFDKLSGLWALVMLMLLLISFIPALNLVGYLFLGVTGSIVYYILQYIFFKQYCRLFVTTHFKAIGVQFCQLLCVSFILFALHVESNFLSYLLVFMISSLLAAFPLTIGGLGVRELAFFYGAKYFVLNEQFSITISLLFFAISALSSLPGIYIVFNKKAINK